MSVQATVTGESKLVDSTTKVVYANGVERDEFNSRLQQVYREQEKPLIQIENTVGRKDGHYRDVEPYQATEDYFIYPISEETYQKLRDVKSL